MDIKNLRLAKDMKYEALYWALGFEELTKNIFTKVYKTGTKITIYSDKQIVNFNNMISIINGTYLSLTTHRSFVILECIDRLLSMGYKAHEIIVDVDNEYDIYCQDLYIKCFEWDHYKEKNNIFNKNVIKSISYESRLISGVIERRTHIKAVDGTIYNCGIFENDQRQNDYILRKSNTFKDNNFIIENGVAIEYEGSDKIVYIPNGVEQLAPGLFWDNQIVEEVHIPNTVYNISGDTFYNCENLREVNIPESVKQMGNNPFAGCPNILISNSSENFNLIDGVLYNKDLTRLIYYPISKKDESYEIIEGCKIIGKHSFYLCHNLKTIVIPNSVIKLENNPFSGCDNLDIINKSNFYHIENCVIYDRDYESVIGCLNSIKSDYLELRNIKRICRNAFWNCIGINKIILPKTIEYIGYNPFVGCSNIEFISKSKNYIVENGILYNSDKSKIICYPAKFANGNVYLPDNVIALERGAFSGCDKMTNIHLHNVSIISKSCFTNCNSLTNVYCSDLVSYIGEWAFAHCKNLKQISVYKDCYIDKNVLLNTKASFIKRESRSNYVIESDNLYTLKSLNCLYKNKIKSIIIDPPYNSKINYIGYKDNFQNDYVNFLKERILLSYDLLTEDGFLVINIDKGELKNVSKICRDLFFKIHICKWEKIHPYFDKNRDVNPNKRKIKYEYIIICFKSKTSKLNYIRQPYIKKEIIFEKCSKVPHIFRCFGTNSSAKDEIKALFGSRTYFQTPKPLKLIKELIRATTDKDSIILDYFAGSGTTGHATEELNKEDNGKRKFILVSNSESNICRNVTAKRMVIINSDFYFLY